MVANARTRTCAIPPCFVRLVHTIGWLVDLLCVFRLFSTWLTCITQTLVLNVARWTKAQLALCGAQSRRRLMLFASSFNCWLHHQWVCMYTSAVLCYLNLLCQCRAEHVTNDIAAAAMTSDIAKYETDARAKASRK